MSANAKLLISLPVLILIAAVIFIVRSSPQKPTPNKQLTVTATFYPLAFFAKEVGGEHVTVAQVIPNGVEPHEYEPTAQDIIAVQSSDVFLYNGNGFDPWAEKIAPEATQKRIAVLDAASLIARNELLQTDNQESDPHIWLDPVLMQTVSENIAKTFGEKDPQNRAYYDQRAGDIVSKLEQLDREFKSGLSNCKSRTIVVSHEAFSYVSKRYGLRMVSIAGLMPEAEPSAADLVRITNFAKKENVQYVFFEPLVSPKLAETVAGEVGAKTLILDPIETLLPEGEAKGDNYYTIMEQNLENLRLALSCQ